MAVDLQKVNALRDVIDQLTDKDKGFAVNLINFATNKGHLSDKQMYWVEKLTERGEQGYGATSQQPREKIGGLEAIKALFESRIAKGNFKRLPKITIGFKGKNDLYQAIRLTVAGDRAKVPGSINVVGVATGNWYGRILDDGTLQQSYKFPAPKKMIDLLKEFAADPVKVVSESGTISGHCSFCNAELTDERSKKVGYGPICAGHYNLPWG